MFLPFMILSVYMSICLYMILKTTRDLNERCKSIENELFLLQSDFGMHLNRHNGLYGGFKQEGKV